MIKKLLIISVFVILASCKKSSNTEIESATPETIKDFNFSITGPASSQSSTVKKGKGKYDVLGFGYDITGKLEDSSAVRAQVIDASAYAIDYPMEVNTSRATYSGATLSYGKNAEDYLRTLSLQSYLNVDSLFFNNAITELFSAPDALTGEYVYGRYKYCHSWKRYGSYWSSLKNNKYLSTDFLNDVQTLTPENLVKKYGTHILSIISMGEKFTVHFQAKVSGTDKLHLSEVGFTYALKKVFAIGSGYMDDLKPKEVNTMTSPKLIYEVVGGEPAKVTKKSTTKGDVIWCYDWQSAFTEDNAVFVEIPRDGLKPLYAMINDPVKKAEVKNYISSYIEKNKSKF